MGIGIGRTVTGLSLSPTLQVLANLQGVVWPVSGLTLDWSTIAAAGSDTVSSTPEGIPIKAGSKFLRYGQVLVRITASGKFGPYDTAASDGRQTLTRDGVFILNETLLEYGPFGSLLALNQTNHPTAFAGGRIWQERLIATTGTHSLANGPTVAELLAVLPQLIFHQP